MKNKKDVQEVKKITTDEDKIKFLETQLNLINDNKNKLYFWIADFKGNVSSSLLYIYDMALLYHNKGYDVTILHTEEKEYVGITEWAGEEYAALKHKCMVDIVFKPEPSDIIFVPDMMLYLLGQLKEVKSKIVVIFQNMNYAMAYRQGITKWYDLNVFDVIVKTKGYEKFINEYLPPIETTVISPKIDNIFLTNGEIKKPYIGVVSKNEVDFNKIVLPFYWKYPQYNWISFIELRGLSKKEFSETLKECAVVLWIDEHSDFGYVPLEASKAECITMAKVPNNLSDWMVDEKDELCDGIVWFDDFMVAPNILASVIDSFLNDKTPIDLKEGMKNLSSLYPVNEFEENSFKFIDKVNKELIERFSTLIEKIKDNKIKK